MWIQLNDHRILNLEKVHSINITKNPSWDNERPYIQIIISPTELQALDKCIDIYGDFNKEIYKKTTNEDLLDVFMDLVDQYQGRVITLDMLTARFECELC